MSLPILLPLMFLVFGGPKMVKNNFLSFVLVGLLIAAVVILPACSTDPVIKNDFKDKTASQDLKKFNNIEEFREFMSLNENSNTYDELRYGSVMDSNMVRSVAESTTASANIKALAQGGGDYSQTNIQIAGVDEADFVKNDDRYIYVLSDNTLVIIDGKDKNDIKIVSETVIPVKSREYYGSSPVNEMFVFDDKIVLFVNNYDLEVYFNQYDIMPVEGYRQNTKVLIYSIADKSKPRIVNEYSISGAYYDSRMIDNIVYTITQENLYNWRYYDGPVISYAKKTIMPEIYYFDNPEDTYNMNTITSIDTTKGEVVDSMSFMLGYGNTLMVSEDNIYIAYQKQDRWCWGWRCSSYDSDSRERFVEVVLPLLDKDLRNKINSIIDKDLDEEKEWVEISVVLSTFFKEVMNDETLMDKYSEMFEDIEDALNEYDAKKALENTKTTIHKISIANGRIDYDSKGEVYGRLLNQFSMDEYDGNLRVATTINVWMRKGQIQHNNIYVLDNKMGVIGSLEGLAENESIYSTRFMGDKLYMVTFRQVDPFFVIDLSVPSTPKVLGYLKIPGYSSYLHPINDKYVIGVGKDTGENEWGGVTTKGVKISLFDVSDFSKPKELDKRIIGMEGSDSPILYDHKAFLYSSSKNMLVIPVTEVTNRIRSGYSYRTSVWYGAYVLRVSEEGFEDIGKIKHSSSETEYYYWFDASNVKRSLYIGDVLYTLSDRYVKANDLKNDLEELKMIRLPLRDESTSIKPMPAILE
jgi:inhibitor of cysteine peptidase